MMALGLGMGLTTLILSLRHRMPVLTAWSTPGAALLAVGLNGVSLNQAVGAFVFCGVLLTLTGVTGLFERLTRTIPDSLANALLAGVLFQFGLSAFEALATDTALVAAMGVAFVAGKLAFPRYAVPVAFLVGIFAAFGLGEFAGTETAAFALSMPIFVMPEFNLTVLIGIGLPLYIVTMCSQNMPGVVTLRGAGYVPPVSSALTVTGLASVLLAPFGGYAFNLAAITAAICAGSEADENPDTRYLASLVAGRGALLPCRTMWRRGHCAVCSCARRLGCGDRRAGAAEHHQRQSRGGPGPRPPNATPRLLRFLWRCRALASLALARPSGPWSLACPSTTC